MPSTVPPHVHRAAHPRIGGDPDHRRLPRRRASRTAAEPTMTGSCRPTRRTSRPTSTTAGSTRWSRSATAIIAVGKFTTVNVDRRRDGHPQQHLRVQRDDGRDRQHVRAQRRHQGGLRHRRRRRRHRLHRRPVQQGQRRRQDRQGRPDQRDDRRGRHDLQGARTSTARSPTCSCPNGKLYIGGGFTTVDEPAAYAARRTQPDDRRRHRHGRLDVRRHRGTAAPSASSTSTSATTAATLVAVGNWRTVNGQSRPQIMMADLSGADRHPERLGDAALHHPVRERLRHLHARRRHRPDGDYFVVAATGAYAGGVDSGTLCDTVSRWEIGPTTAGQDPTWVDYSGGDTFTQVKVDRTGHLRRRSHALAEQPVRRRRGRPGRGLPRGPGRPRPAQRAAVQLEPEPRPRGRRLGVPAHRPPASGSATTPTSTGEEARKRIALFPSAGGTQLPLENTGSLPGDVFLLGQPAGVDERATGSPGSTPAAAPCSPPTTAPTGPPTPATSPRRTATATATPPTGATCHHPRREPAQRRTPTGIFSTERWSPNDSPNMQWDFPAPAGHDLTVRLYFANGCSCTASRRPARVRRGDRRHDGARQLRHRRRRRATRSAR